MPLDVITRHPGHYGDQHRRVGDRFTLAAASDFSVSWMDPVGWDPKAPATEPPQPDITPPTGKPGRPHKATPLATEPAAET